jgi:hypothetical protein
MDCPNCKSPIKFFDLLRINHKSPYNCPVCFKKSGFNHNKKIFNLIAGIAGLAGVALFYLLNSFGWETGLMVIFVFIVLIIVIFFRFAELEIVEENNE